MNFNVLFFATGETVDLRSAKDLLKQNMLHMNARKMQTSMSNKRDDSAILKNLVPVLGKGLSPGQNLSFDFTSPRNSSAPEHYAKVRLSICIILKRIIKYSVSNHCAVKILVKFYENFRSI